MDRVTNRALRGLTSVRAAPYVSVMTFVAIWQLTLPFLPTTQLPDPAEVFRFMVDEVRGETLSRYTIYEAFGLSGLRMLIGLAIAGIGGTLLGLAIGRSRLFAAATRDWILGALMAPHLIFALLFAMWLGFTFWTPIWTVVLAALPFVALNIAEGVENVPRDLIEMSDAYGVERRRVLTKIVLPSLVPYGLAASRYAIAIGWKALILAEIWGATDGAGWVIRYWYDAHRVTALIGYALFFVILVLGIDHLVLKPVSRHLLRWQVRSVQDTMSKMAIPTLEVGVATAPANGEAV